MNLKLIIDMTTFESTVLLPKLAQLMKEIEATVVADHHPEQVDILSQAIKDLENRFPDLESHKMASVQRSLEWLLEDPSAYVESHLNWIEKTSELWEDKGTSPVDLERMKIMYLEEGFLPQDLEVEDDFYWRLMTRRPFSDNHKLLLHVLYHKSTHVRRYLSPSLSEFVTAITSDRTADDVLADDILQQPSVDFVRRVAAVTDLTYEAIQVQIRNGVRAARDEEGDITPEPIFRVIGNLLESEFRVQSAEASWIGEEMLSELLKVSSTAQLNGILGGFGRRVFGTEGYYEVFYGNTIEQRVEKGNRYFRLNPRFRAFLDHWLDTLVEDGLEWLDEAYQFD